MLTQKNKLRSFYVKKLKDLKQKRSSTEFKDQEKQIIKKLSSFNFWDSQCIIASYQSLPDEVSLEAFHASHLKSRFVFPLICENHLEFYFPDGKDSFQRNSFSLLEPIPEKSKKVSLKDIDVFLIPGRVFDRQGGRLGRGRAYYDKTLSKSSIKESSLKIGIAFKEQIYEESFPLEEHDVLMDAVVTGSFILIPRATKTNLNHFDKRTA